MKLTKLGIMFLCILMLSCINVFAEQTDEQATQAEFQKIDSNKDSVITPEEMQVYQKEMFKALDKDSDGVLDNEERKADATGIFQSADKSNDGKVDWEEANLQFNKYLNEMDSDKDGTVSEKEFKVYNPVVLKF